MRDAATFAIFISVLRVITAVVFLVHPPESTSRLFWFGSLCDCALLLGLAYGVYQMSTLCAILMLVYYVGDQLAKFFFFPEFAKTNMAGFILALGAFVLTIRAIFAAFRYHALVENSPDNLYSSASIDLSDTSG